MQAKRKLFLALIFLIIFYIPQTSSQEKGLQNIENFISLLKQKSGIEIQLDDVGWTWKEQDFFGASDQGGVTFSDSKWLMYLIHWGPIQVQKITVDYVKKRMLDMWGVKFEFSGKQGEMKVSGHDAVWVEAYGTNKSFYTRFIIWNCPQSGREFIADTNYNIRLKTPEKDFESERRSAQTVSCHEGSMPDKFPDLTRKFHSERYGISYFYPEQWFLFESPFYVPFPQYEGTRDRKMGSLLALPSDQNLQVTLKWYPSLEEKEEMVMGIDQKISESLSKEIESQEDVQSFENQGFESFLISGKKVYKIWGNYKLKNLEEKEKEFYTGDGIFEVSQWNLKEKGKKIVVILKTRNFQYAANVSSPSRHFQDEFLKALVLQTK